MKHLTPAERARKWREEHTLACANCGRIMQIKGKGLCATCYNMEWRKTDKAKSIIKRNNEARNGRRKRNGKNIWGSNLWHALAELPCEICGWQEASRDIHHIYPRSAGGKSIAENMVTLCPNHHRLVHEGIISTAQIEEIVLGRSELQINDTIKQK